VTLANQDELGLGTKEPETIEWSQVRYDDRACIAVDVTPARYGRPTTGALGRIAAVTRHHGGPQP